VTPRLVASDLDGTLLRSDPTISAARRRHVLGREALAISGAAVTKAHPLQQVAERLAVEAPDVVAFGDVPNDAPMLESAGHGVALVLERLLQARDG
jgi:hydroxymethylpyrimidine pyrophosphatase-like HAD family hydrolase